MCVCICVYVSVCTQYTCGGRRQQPMSILTCWPPWDSFLTLFVVVVVWTMNCSIASPGVSGNSSFHLSIHYWRVQIIGTRYCPWLYEFWGFKLSSSYMYSEDLTLHYHSNHNFSFNFLNNNNNRNTSISETHFPGWINLDRSWHLISIRS